MKEPPFSTGRSARSGHGPRRSWSTNQAMPANPETSSRHLHQLCARRIRLRACTRNTRTHHTHHTHTHARVRTHTHTTHTHTHAHAHAHTHTHSRKRHADRQQARTDCKVEARLFFPELPGDSEREARFFCFFFFFSFGFDFFLLCFFEAWLSLPLSLLLLLLLRDRRRHLVHEALKLFMVIQYDTIKQQPVPGCCAPH